MSYFKCEDWDFYGFPGEFVYGDDVYVDDYYMSELWKPDVDFPNHYWVSNKGRVWSNISNDFIYGSPTGRCGHIDLSLKINGKRYHKYLHRMVAEAFIPNHYDFPIVRHLDDNPGNNCVENLAWGTQLDNVRDCINNGNFRYFNKNDIEAANTRRRTPVVSVRLRDGKQECFISKSEAAKKIGVSISDICEVAAGRRKHAKGYFFMCEGGEKIPDNVDVHYHAKRPLILGTNLTTNKRVVFKGLTEASYYTGVSIGGISMILHQKTKTPTRWSFEYLDEVDK